MKREHEEHRNHSWQDLRRLVSAVLVPIYMSCRRCPDHFFQKFLVLHHFCRPYLSHFWSLQVRPGVWCEDADRGTDPTVGWMLLIKFPHRGLQASCAVRYCVVLRAKSTVASILPSHPEVTPCQLSSLRKKKTLISVLDYDGGRSCDRIRQQP